MADIRDYDIEYLGLKIGQYTWQFRVNDKFFDLFEYSEIKQGDLNVDVTLDKHDRMLVFDFKIDGYVSKPCDRCMEELKIELHDSKRLIFKFGDSYREESDEIIIIPEKKNCINIASFILEFVTLLVPMRNVHPDDPDGKSLCSPEIIEKLQKLNTISGTDPRWDKLKDLLKE